jgi:hypothetical protein
MNSDKDSIRLTKGSQVWYPIIIMNMTESEKAFITADASAAKKLPRAVLRLFATIFVMLGIVSFFSFSGDAQRTSDAASAVCAGLITFFSVRYFCFSSQFYLQIFC